jgi:hypothetical protein
MSRSLKLELRMICVSNGVEVGEISGNYGQLHSQVLYYIESVQRTSSYKFARGRTG